MKQKSIKKNYTYNLSLIFANMLFPLITAPYLSEVLGAMNIGKVNYATAIVNWFIIIAGFGIPRFAVREIAKFRDDKNKTTAIFWNLIFIQAFISIFFLAIYTIFISNVAAFRQDIRLHLLMSLMLALNIINIEWFYKGIEEYGYITVRNIIVKCLCVLTIFLLINSDEDYIFLAAITIGMVGINNLANFFHAFKYVDTKIPKLSLVPYLKQIRIFFFISIVVALYTQLDQVLLGSVSTVGLAFYMRSKSILNIGQSLTTSLITVISPRAAYLTQTDRKSYVKMVQKSINYIYLLGIPISVGFFLFAYQAMYLLGGFEFAQASLALQIMAPLSFIITLGSWVSSQILIPNGFEKISFKIQCFAVVISIFLNTILISYFTYIGVVITRLLVEVFLLIAKTIYANLKCPDIKPAYFSVSLMKIIFASGVMTLILVFSGITKLSPLSSVVFGGVLGAAVYFLVLTLLREQVVLLTLKELKIKLKG